MRFASLLSGGFTTLAVMNPPEKKLANRTIRTILFEISFDLQFQDEEDITERIAAPESGGMANGNIEIETVFGPKIRRRKKKMETRLLKEILSDFSFTKRKGKTDFHGSLF